MSLLVWELEWRVALRRRRLFVLNLVIPLLLVVPIAMSPAPAVHAAAVYTVLFTLFATFGSAIPLIREGENGLVGRFLLAGIRPRAFLLQRVGAQAALDTLQLALPLLVIVATGSGADAGSAGGAGASAGPGWGAVWEAAAGSTIFFLRATAILFLALLLANLLGVWVAALARSVAEGALFAAVSALLLLHGSGTFRTPLPGSPGALAADVIPFSALHRMLLQATGGGAGGGTAALLVGVAAALGVTLLPARFFLERIAASGEG